MRKQNRRLQKHCIHKHRINSTTNLLHTGTFGFFSLGHSIITKEQIECCRVLIRRELRKKGFLLIRTSFTMPITSKTSGVRMGKGKGAIDKYIQVINMFDCLFELKEISLLLAVKLLKKISYKLPVSVCLIDKDRNIFIAK